MIINVCGKNSIAFLIFFSKIKVIMDKYHEMCMTYIHDNDIENTIVLSRLRFQNTCVFQKMTLK